MLLEPQSDPNPLGELFAVLDFRYSSSLLPELVDDALVVLLVFFVLQVLHHQASSFHHVGPGELGFEEHLRNQYFLSDYQRFSDILLEVA